MKIRESIQRIGWRFGEAAKKTNKSFVLNQKDVDAITEISRYYEKQASLNASNNQLLIKMYIWHKIEMMKHYKEDVFGLRSQKRLAETLCKPTQSFYNRFVSFLNEFEYLAYIEKENPLDKPYFLLSPEDKNRFDKNLEEKFKNNPEVFKTLSGDTWTLEDVKDNLTSEINQLMIIANNN